MYVIPNLLSLVTQPRIGFAGDRALGEIGEKAVQLGAGVPGSGQAAATKTRGKHAEVAAVFLHDHVSGKLRGAEQAMEARIDAHALVDATGSETMLGAHLPPQLLFNER